MASSLVARRTSIAKLLKPYYPSSSSGCAGLFSLASRNPNRELGNSPTSSASIVPGGREESRAPIFPPGAAFDPIRRSLTTGPISLSDQKARSSSSVRDFPWDREPDWDKYKDKIERRMKSVQSESKVLASLAAVDLLSFGWECCLTPAGSSWISEAAVDRCYWFSVSVFFAAYAMRRSLKSPNFSSWTVLDIFLTKHVLTIAHFTAPIYMIMYAYLILKPAAPLVALL